MRDAAIDIIREIGVDTGGSNIQFALNPDDGRLCVIEMNPRVSRSSALASKATGFPIAKIAALLSVGYTLDEIPNDITKKTPASFEPTIDYVVTKIPKFTFEKFPGANDTLTTQMKSVGEVMAIGRSFKESMQKAIRSMESGAFGFERQIGTPEAEAWSYFEPTSAEKELIRRSLQTPTSGRFFYIAEAIRGGFSTDEIYSITSIDPWFIDRIREIVSIEDELYNNIKKPARRSYLERLRRTVFPTR